MCTSPCWADLFCDHLRVHYCMPSSKMPSGIASNRGVGITTRPYFSFWFLEISFCCVSVTVRIVQISYELLLCLPWTRWWAVFQLPSCSLCAMSSHGPSMKPKWRERKQQYQVDRVDQPWQSVWLEKSWSPSGNGSMANGGVKEKSPET